MKKVSKLIKLTTAILLVVGLSACGKSTATTQASPKAEEAAKIEATGVLGEVLKKGVLTIATSPDYAPMEFLDDKQQPIGSDMELAKYIAEQLGVELKIETMDFSGTLTAVDTGKVDLAISGFGWKEDRAESYELSIGYNKGENSESACHTVLVKKEDVAKYPTAESMKGLTIAAQSASLQEMYVTDQIPEAKLEIVQQIDQGVIALKSGKVQGLALSCDIAKGFANTMDDTAIVEFKFDLSKYEDYAGNVIVAKKGETDLINKVNEIIKEVNETGKFEVWHKEAKEKAKELGINFE